MTLLLAVIGIVIIVLLIRIIHTDSKASNTGHNSNSFSDVSPTRQYAASPSASQSNSIPPQDRIPKMAAEICIFFDVMRTSDSLSRDVKNELMYLLPAFYLFPSIQANLLGKTWQDLIAYSVYAAIKEAQETESSELLCVVCRTILLQETVGMHSESFAEMAANAVIHYRKEIEEIVQVYSPRFSYLYTVSIDFGTNLDDTLKLLIRDYEYGKQDYKLTEYRTIAETVVPQLVSNPIIQDYLNYVKKNKSKFPENE